MRNMGTSRRLRKAERHSHADVTACCPVVTGDGSTRPNADQIRMASQFLDAHGLVLFRRFAVVASDLASWIRLFGSSYRSARFAPGASRTSGSGIALHTEGAMTPCVPMWVWFYCIQPAKWGGDTLVCDGVRAAAALSSSSRSYLESHDVLYWKRRSGPSGPHLETEDGQILVDPPELGRSFRQIDNRYCGSYYEHWCRCRPLINSRSTGQRVFGNSILTAVRHDDGRPPIVDGFHQVRTTTNERLPEDIVSELVAVTDQLSFDIRLKAQDLLWIDNTRFLHGRRGFRGPRQIIVQLGYHPSQRLRK